MAGLLTGVRVGTYRAFTSLGGNQRSLRLPTHFKPSALMFKPREGVQIVSTGAIDIGWEDQKQLHLTGLGNGVYKLDLDGSHRLVAALGALSPSMGVRFGLQSLRESSALNIQEQRTLSVIGRADSFIGIFPSFVQRFFDSALHFIGVPFGKFDSIANEVIAEKMKAKRSALYRQYDAIDFLGKTEKLYSLHHAEALINGIFHNGDPSIRWGDIGTILTMYSLFVQHAKVLDRALEEYSSELKEIVSLQKQLAVLKVSLDAADEISQEANGIVGAGIANARAALQGNISSKLLAAQVIVVKRYVQALREIIGGSTSPENLNIAKRDIAAELSLLESRGDEDQRPLLDRVLKEYDAHIFGDTMVSLRFRSLIFERFSPEFKADRELSLKVFHRLFQSLKANFAGNFQLEGEPDAHTLKLLRFQVRQLGNFIDTVFRKDTSAYGPTVPTYNVFGLHGFNRVLKLLVQNIDSLQLGTQDSNRSKIQLINDQFEMLERLLRDIR